MRPFHSSPQNMIIVVIIDLGLTAFSAQCHALVSLTKTLTCMMIGLKA